MPAWTKAKEFLTPWLRRLLCLILCVSLLLCPAPQKVDALALESLTVIGLTACLILMSVGVVFNPKTIEDVQAIGQNFQLYMYQWGTSAEKLDEVEDWFNGLSLYSPDDDDWSPNKTKIRLARGLLTGISLWCASIMLGTRNVQTESDEPVTSDGFSNFVGTSVSGGYPANWPTCLSSANFPFFDFLRLCGVNDKVMIIFGSNQRHHGYFFDSDGVLRCGVFDLGNFSSSSCTILPLSEAPLLYSAKPSSYPIYFSEEWAKNDSSTCYIPNWDEPCGLNSVGGSAFTISVFKKSGNSSEFVTTPSNASFYMAYVTSQDCTDSNSYAFMMSSFSGVYPSGTILESSVVGNIVDELESGNISNGELPLYDLNYGTLFPDPTAPLESVQDLGDMLVAGTLTLDKYLEMGQAADPGAAEPVWTQDIPLGSAVEYEQNSVADPVEVLASVDDGGTITYEWYRYGTDPDGNVYPVEVIETGPVLVPQTAALGTSYYYCSAYNTSESGLVSFRVASTAIAVTVVPASVVDPDPGTDPEPGGDSVTDAGVDAGHDLVDQLQDVIPNYSEGFGNVLSDFASNFSYEGTDAVLTVPALRFPEIPGMTKGKPLIPEYVLMEEQKVDFAEYVELVPDVILTLVRCLLTGALILFCVKEFYGIVAYILTLRKEG